MAALLARCYLSWPIANAKSLGKSEAFPAHQQTCSRSSIVYWVMLSYKRSDSINTCVYISSKKRCIITKQNHSLALKYVFVAKQTVITRKP
jgi:hypothetical protein